jgi:cytochrome oxidase Cu insertion factor (SCO1/SenC/PrrC family)
VTSKNWVAGAAAIAVVAVALMAPAGAAAPGEPPASVGVATIERVPASVLNAEFVNQRGQDETLGALKGREIFVVPLLTLCGDTCPFTSGNLLQLQDRLDALRANNVSVVTISVDPYRDTVARLAAYAGLFDANFQLWTERGHTTTPTLTATELKSKNPVGTGDTNPNLTAVEKFLGWTVQVVPQGNPPSTDWMAPHEKLAYDIQHSDGFWIINGAQQVRFVSGTKPAFTGQLSKVLATFMGYKTNIYKHPVYKPGWTPGEALQALEWVAGKTF